jgi:uncharacterized protein YndB with AHSA1/START domain
VSRNSIHVDAPPTAVFAVLDDAEAYPRWVVGAREIRHVDADWPAPGSRFDHEVGAPAANVDDDSEVLAREWPRELDLEVRFRPVGVARVHVSVRPDPSGSRIELEEHTRRGAVDRLPGLLVEPLLHVRNAWSLRRLRREVERRVNEVTRG